MNKLSKQELELKYFSKDGRYCSYKSEARKKEIDAELLQSREEKSKVSSNIVKAMAKIMLLGAALSSKEALLPIRGIILHCSDIARS